MADEARLLREPLGPGEAVVWHLFHSGVAIRVRAGLLLFDYYLDKPSRPGDLAAGVVDPGELAGLDVYVFISHEHRDHFYQGCWDWRERLRGIRYIVAPEVGREDSRFSGESGPVTVLAPGQEAEAGALRVLALRSTDSGVAFLVQAGGLSIYHAGDLACWNWEDDPGAKQAYVSKDLELLKGRRVDIACQVTDPRLAKLGWGGVFAFAEAFEPRLLVPIHFMTAFKPLKLVAGEFAKRFPRTAFWQVSRRGDCVRYNDGRVLEVERVQGPRERSRTRSRRP